MEDERGSDSLAEALSLIADVVTFVLADQESSLSEASRDRLAALTRNLKGAAAGLISPGVDRLGVGRRIQAALVDAGVVYVDQLQEMSDEQLLAIKGVGPATLAEIRRAVEDHARPWRQRP